MKRLRMTAALTAAALCMMLLPALPAAAEELPDGVTETAAESAGTETTDTAAQPVFTATAVPDHTKGVIRLADGSEWCRVPELKDGQEYLIAAETPDGGLVLLTLETGAESHLSWLYDTGNGETTALPRISLRAGEYQIINDEGRLSTDISVYPEGTAIMWRYEEPYLECSRQRTPSFLKYDADAEIPFTLTADSSEASVIRLFANSATSETLAHCITGQPRADSYVLENSGYAAPTFTVQIQESVTLDSVQWFVDGEQQSCTDTSFTADSLTGQPAGLHRIRCRIEGHDADDIRYREYSETASFVIASGVLEESVLTFSDIHEEYSLIGDAVENVMQTHNGCIPALIICTGDFCNSWQTGYDDMKQKNLPRIEAALGGLDTVYVAGNHDSGKAASEMSVKAGLGAAADLPESGGLIFDGKSETAAANGKNSLSAKEFIVYGLNYGAAVIKTEEGSACSYENVLADLEAFLAETAADYHGETIVISAHSGLHVLGMQPGSIDAETGNPILEWSGNKEYNLDKSYEMVTLLNRYAEEYDMDILYLFGHNHSRMENELILTDGDTIVSTKSFGEQTFGEQTVHFTYAHAGYLSGEIGCADDRFSLICRSGNALSIDLTSTTDGIVKHTAIPLRYRADYASTEVFAQMAKTDYELKHPGTAVSAEAVRSTDGTVTVTLRNEATGASADVYTLDAKTGIGTDSAGAAVSLPLTGISDVSDYLLIIGAFLLIGSGVYLVCRKKSRRGKGE